MAKKITQAQKIRNYREKHTTATIADIAQALGIRYQAVYAVLKPNGKTDKPAKQKWKMLHMSTSKAPVKPIMIDMTQHADGSITEKVTEGYWANHIQEDKPVDNVNHPAHYKVGGIETIDFIEAKGLGYNLGNVIKYIARADHKSDTYEDLCKARWYLNREIARLTESK